PHPTSSPHRAPHHPDLHSFPTRRSSDLPVIDCGEDRPVQEQQHQTDHYQRRHSGISLPTGSRKDQTGKNCDERGQLLKHSPEKIDRKSTRLNSSHVAISYAVFCLKKKKK